MQYISVNKWHFSNTLFLSNDIFQKTESQQHHVLNGHDSAVDFNYKHDIKYAMTLWLKAREPYAQIHL